MKRIFLFLLSLSLVTNVFAEVKVKATTKSAVAVGDRFSVEYSVNDKATDIRADLKIEGLDVLYGPTVGSSLKIVNGVQSLSTTFTYTMVAHAEGTYKIPEATVTVGGKTYTSNALSIKVLPADQSAGSNQNSRKQDRGSQKVNADDVHLELSLSKTNAYEGEAVVATLKLYFRNTPIHSLTDAKLPDFDGFTVIDMDLANQEATLEHYKGANYQMYPIKQWLLFPSRSGEITIAPAHVTVIAQVVTRSSSGGWFDFPMDYTTNVEVPLKTTSRTVRVSSLPAGKPASYSNGVGNFSINAEVTSNKVKANDALIYRITLEGTGNLKYIKEPSPEFPSDFEVYDPKVDLNARTTSQGMSGKKVMEYTVIPRHAGTFEIPSIDFAYFDTKSGQYKTLSTNSISIEVEKGVGGDSNGNVSNFTGTNQERLKVLGNDVRYIRNIDPEDFKETESEESFFGSFNYWLFYLIPVLLLAILAVVYRRQLKLNANADLRRTRKANKIANKRLKEAAVALKSKNQNDFYEALHKAMFGYVGDKLNIKLSELSNANVREQLAKHNVSEALITEYEDIISSCEFARYAPSNDASAMDQLFRRASECLNNLESQIKK